LYLCRYSNSAAFISEMKGLEFKDSAGKLQTGEQLLEGHPLNNDLSIGQNFAVLAGMLIFLRIIAFIGLKLAYRLRWL
jgi:hypothetical protein